MAVFEVEHSGGYWRVRTGAETVPLRMAGQPVAALVPGWQAKFVYAGFAPIYLLELAHDNGDRATWFLDATMNRLGGELEELPAETRSLLSQKYLEVSQAPWRSLMTSLEPAWPATVDGLADVNARTVYGLEKWRDREMGGTLPGTTPRRPTMPRSRSKAAGRPYRCRLSISNRCSPSTCRRISWRHSGPESFLGRRP